jgi:hypothetical protein
MKNYEKVRENLDSYAISVWLHMAKLCPFHNGEECEKCEFYNKYPVEGEEICKFPKDVKSIMEWLEREV